MSESRTVMELDRLIPYLCPQREGGAELRKNPPDPTALSAAGLRGEGVFPQTPLTLRLRFDEGEVSLTGTADAVWTKDGYTVAEEMALDRHVDFYGSFRDRALCRARFLALALCHTKKLSRVKIRLICVAEGRVEWEDVSHTKEELTDLLSPLAHKIFSLLPLFYREPPAVAFPHETLRQGQKDMIHALWNGIKGGTKCYVCAPTGIGKTAAALYPALRALELGKARQVYYASPKNTLKRQAAQTVEAMQKVKTLRTLVLSAKMSLCPLKTEECQREGCEYALNFYEKLPDALIYLSSFSLITEKELTLAAETYRVCPFELALKMQAHCQVIIGDYNHIFDPSRSITIDRKNSILLVDEAHNLPARVRENHTETLAPEDFDLFFRKEDPVFLMLRPHLTDLLSLFAAVEKDRNESRLYHSFSPPEKAAKAVEALLPKLGFALHEGFGPLEEDDRNQLTALFQRSKNFLRLFRLWNEDYACIFPPEGGIRIHLVDPRDAIEKASAPWKSAAFFSATLQPEEYFFRVLGGVEEDQFLVLDSPFPRDNLFVGLVPVDVSYSNRYQTAAALCNVIRTATETKRGNYMVFLPSFDYLRLVSQEYKRRFLDDQILIQERVMTRKKREEFLNAFETNRGKKLIGFCVMGGIFAEGVDLKGDSLSGEIIVGTGFPPPSPEGEAESEAYYKKDMDGKGFAYTLPGWSRVLQAAGRVIRSETDRGFILLCDNRYQEESIKELFPAHWENAELIERDSELHRKLLDFWK